MLKSYLTLAISSAALAVSLVNPALAAPCEFIGINISPNTCGTRHLDQDTSEQKSLTQQATTIKLAARSQQIREPNQFELQGNNTKIIYSTTSISGVPLLSYQDQRRKLNFSGEEIRLIETEIGKLVTVTIEAVPDLQTVTLTLLLPTVNLPDGTNKNLIQVKGVLTTQRTSIGGPSLVEGQLQSYRTLTLQGTARLINS